MHCRRREGEKEQKKNKNKLIFFLSAFSDAGEIQAWGECGTKVGECVQAGGGTVDKVCPCYGDYLKCIDAKPALAKCAGFDTTKKSFVDACNVLKCSTCSASGVVASVSMVVALLAARFF